MKRLAMFSSVVILLLLWSFSSSASAQTISFTASVKTPSQGSPPVVAVSGATIEMVGNPSVTATSDVNGLFTITGLPSGTPFSLKISKAGYVPTYTKQISGTSNITSLADFYLLTPEQLASFGLTQGKKLIILRALDPASPAPYFMSGVTATFTSTAYPSNPPYTLTYDQNGTPGGTSTSGNGKIYVLNVDDTDVVTVNASKAGYTFSPAIFVMHADGISMGAVTGTAGGSPTISASGTVQTAGPTPSPLSGVTLEQVGNASINATSDGSGAFTVSGLPSGQNFHLKMINTGYVPTYTKVFNSTQNITMLRPYVMYTEQEAGTLKTAFQVPWDTSVIAGRVVDQSNPLSSYITGAVVSYISAFGRTSYRVVYEGGGNSTAAEGKFYILDVEEGDTVQVTATKAGWTFPTVIFATHSDGLMMGAIGGTGSGGGGDDPNILSLAAGWTMFSIPKQAADTSIEFVLSSVLSDVVVVYGFDNEAKEWKRYRPGAQEGENTLATIEQGKAYWIYLKNSGSINMSSPSWQSQSTTVHLYEGWNLVGYSGTSAPVETSLAGIDGWVVSWTWCEDAWHLKHATLSDLPVLPFSMFNQKKGYWVFMEPGASGDWSQ